VVPHSYELPAAALLVAGGALACFAGYRLFRVVLGIYGFIAGAMFASSMMGPAHTIGMIVAAIVGGIAGSIILVFAYFVGIALIGAGIGAMIAHLGWLQFGAGDPPWYLVVLLAVLGAIGAMVLQRYVIIVGTAFGGAWTLLVGALAIAGDQTATRATATANVWILYPMSPAPGQRWLPFAWVALGVVGTAIQLGVTGKKRK
jgi:uncharacterized protein DUF4203